jgi:hypothetical protein
MEIGSKTSGHHIKGSGYNQMTLYNSNFVNINGKSTNDTIPKSINVHDNANATGRPRMRNHSQVAVGGGNLRVADNHAPLKRSQPSRGKKHIKRLIKEVCNSSKNVMDGWLIRGTNDLSKDRPKSLLPTPDVHDKTINNNDDKKPVTIIQENAICSEVCNDANSFIARDKLVVNQPSTTVLCDGSCQTLPTLKCDKRLQTSDVVTDKIAAKSESHKGKLCEPTLIVPVKKGENTVLCGRGTMTDGPLAYCNLDYVPKRNIRNATHLVNVFTPSLDRQDRRTLRGNIIALTSNALKQARCGGALIFNLYHQKYDMMPDYIVKGAEVKIKCTMNVQIQEAMRLLHGEILTSNINDLRIKFDELKKEWINMVNTIRRFLNNRLRDKERTDTMSRIMKLAYKVRLGSIYLQMHKHEKKANKVFCNSEHLCGTKRIWVTNIDGKVAAGEPIARRHRCNKNHYAPSVADYMNPRGNLSWETGRISLEHIETKVNKITPNVDYDVTKSEWSLEEWNTFLKDFSSNHSIPSMKSEKGQKEEFEKDWQRMLYGLRWKAVIDNMPKREEDKLNLPFKCPFVRLPEPLDNHTEMTMEHHKTKIVRSMKDKDNEAKAKTWKDLQEFMVRENTLLVSTDKTKRNVLMKKDKVIEVGENFLNNNDDYKKLKTSNVKNITKEANDIMKKLVAEAGFNKREASKLTSKYTKGAQF